MEEIFVKEFIVEGGLWRCHSRLESTLIANPCGSTEKAELVVVERQHVLD
jgi:hypothetical protein